MRARDPDRACAAMTLHMKRLNNYFEELSQARTLQPAPAVKRRSKP
jgi:hypothetical protein